MRVWGMGSYWNDSKPQNKIDAFITNQVASIGWTKEQAPALYNMVQEMEKGDIIYIKSYVMKKRELRIKAIGIITDKKLLNIEKLNDQCFSVNWIKKPEDNLPAIEMERRYLRYNVYSCTLYPEYNEEIAEKIREMAGFPKDYK